MITQTIKKWLSYLFAWWPWKRTATTAYAPPSRNGAMGISQEHLWSASSEESIPQIGTRLVVVEQTNENAPPEATLPLTSLSIEHVDTITQSTSPRDVSFLPRLTQDEKILENPDLPTTQSDSETTPIPAQQMAFLKYLVCRGLINEGFEEGCVPEQYRPKQ